METAPAPAFGRPQDTDPEVEERRIEILRRMSPERKLELVDDAIRTSRQLLLAGLRQRHPEEGEELLERRLLGLVLGEELATRAYGPPRPPGAS